jgi:PEP-CTERM motif
MTLLSRAGARSGFPTGPYREKARTRGLRYRIVIAGAHTLTDIRMETKFMPKTFRSSVAAIVAMVGVTAMGVATPARAGLVIELSTDGVTWDTFAAPSYTNANYHGFNINVLSVDSNSPGTSALTYLEGSDVHIANNNAGIATLYIKLGDTDFTSPTTLPGINLDSQIGGSVTVGGKDNKLTYQSYVDPLNGQSTLTGFTAGPQNPVITGTPKSYSNDATTLITSGLTAPYSITEYLQITLDKGSQVGFQSSTNLSSVPEPSSLVLSGISVLGLAGYALRRRKAVGA